MRNGIFADGISQSNFTYTDDDSQRCLQFSRKDSRVSPRIKARRFLFRKGPRSSKRRPQRAAFIYFICIFKGRVVKENAHIESSFDGNDDLLFCCVYYVVYYYRLQHTDNARADAEARGGPQPDEPLPRRRLEQRRMERDLHQSRQPTGRRPQLRHQNQFVGRIARRRRIRSATQRRRPSPHLVRRPHQSKELPFSSSLRDTVPTFVSLVKEENNRSICFCSAQVGKGTPRARGDQEDPQRKWRQCCSVLGRSSRPPQYGHLFRKRRHSRRAG